MPVDEIADRDNQADYDHDIHDLTIMSYGFPMTFQSEAGVSQE